MFVALVQEFVNQEGLNYGDILVDGTGQDNNHTVTLHDTQLAQRWKDFHREKASLRVTTITANLTRKRKTTSN